MSKSRKKQKKQAIDDVELRCKKSYFQMIDSQEMIISEVVSSKEDAQKVKKKKSSTFHWGSGESTEDPDLIKEYQMYTEGK